MSSSDCKSDKHDSRCKGIEGMYEHCLEQIELGRWSVVAVLPGKDSPPFAYTAGLSVLGFPELIIVGVPDDVSHPILNNVGRGFVDRSIAAKHGTVMDSVASMDSELFRVSVGAMHQYMSLCRKVSQRKNGGFKALQVVWPDEEGLFPWEDGCNHYCHCVQRMLLDV